MQQSAEHVLTYTFELGRHDVKFLHKQLDHWVERHLGRTPTAPRCELVLDSDGPQNYLCRAHIKAGDKEWVGQDYGKSPQDAAVRALKHLHTKRFIAAS